eukprot:14110493-Alexandrium_andersonii.AAC.1
MVVSSGGSAMSSSCHPHVLQPDVGSDLESLGSDGVAPTIVVEANASSSSARRKGVRTDREVPLGP